VHTSSALFLSSILFFVFSLFYLIILFCVYFPLNSLLYHRYSLLPEVRESQVPADYQPDPKKGTISSILGDDADVDMTQQVVDLTQPTTSHTTTSTTPHPTTSITPNNTTNNNNANNINLNTNNYNINVTNVTNIIQTLPPLLEKAKLTYKRERPFESVTQNVTSLIACSNSNLGMAGFVFYPFISIFFLANFIL
jgi:hypothetical protein